jgi:hypothetical protein
LCSMLVSDCVRGRKLCFCAISTSTHFVLFISWASNGEELRYYVWHSSCIHAWYGLLCAKYTKLTTIVDLFGLFFLCGQVLYVLSSFYVCLFCFPSRSFSLCRLLLANIMAESSRCF